MNKKIAIVTTNISNNGGTERVISNVSNMLSDDYKITIYSLSTRDSGCFYRLNSNIEIVHLGMIDYEHEKSKIKKCISKISNVYHSISTLNIIEADLIIGVNKNINILLALAFLFDKKKHTIWGWEHFANNAPMSWITKIIRDSLYKKLSGIIVLTDFDKKYYESKKIKAALIENAFTILDQNEKKINNNEIALAIGRHTTQKRFDKLLYAWKEINASCAGWQLRIVGNGPLLDDNIKLAKELGVIDTVVFIPPTKNIQIEYQKASLFLMTSDYEAFPMVLLEALSNGVPCIAYDCDTGPRDIITDGVDGYVIPGGEQNMFVDKTVMTMGSVDLRQKLGTNARIQVKRFSEEKIKQKWMSNLKKILEL